MDIDRISGIELNGGVTQLLRDVLSNIPNISVASTTESGGLIERGVDQIIEISTPEGTKILYCHYKSRAWTNELTSAKFHIERSQYFRGWHNCYALLIAPSVSDSAAKTCEELGLSWVDLAGNCNLALDGLFIKIRGNPNPHAKSRGTATLFSPKSAQVVHALLNHPGRQWTHSQLANVSGVSQAQVSSVKKLIENNGWIQAKYGEIRLTHPIDLLADWKEHYKPKRTAHQFFTLDSTEDLERKISENFPDFALTEVSSSEHYAPYVRNNRRLSFYSSNWKPEYAQAMGLRDGEGGSNVTVYQTDDVQFPEEIDGVRCASPIQTYLDLSLLSGRGRDAAEHLYETVILPRWQ